MNNEVQVLSTKIQDELQLTQDLEMELTSLDESMVPNVIVEHMSNLAVINENREMALKKKEAAQRKVDEAFSKAENLVDKAEALGKLDVKTHKFFTHEWSTKGERIEALEECVKNIGEYGSDTAELQKSIIEIQNATLESQEAIMDVQKYQMEYMDGTTKVMKFLYGLSAYGIASTESIVTNMQLILSGVRKKELGEMAKQQMYLVMDQLKSQENLHNRMDKTENRIEELQEEVHIHFREDYERDRRILEGEEKNQAQDQEIIRQAQINDELIERVTKREIKDQEHDEKIEKGENKDKEHDDSIHQLMDSTANFSNMFVEKEEKDRSQDQEIIRQAQIDKEHDKKIAVIEDKNTEQDEEIQKLINEDYKNIQKINEFDLKFQDFSNEFVVLEKRINDKLKSKANKVINYIALIIAILAFILSIIQFWV